MNIKNNKIVSRKLKDSLFTNLFSDVKYLRKLYEAFHNDGAEFLDEDFKIITLDNIFVNGVYNDLGVLIKDRIIILAEAQSTFNPNMAMRFLIYVAQTYQTYIMDNEINIYGTASLKFPKPEFILIYTGDDEKAEKKILNLSELFYNGEESSLELKINVITSKNVQKSILKEYIEFCQKYDKYRKGSKTKEEVLNALKKTVDYCIANDILKEYLKSREKEVEEIMITLFTDEQISNMMLKDEYKKAQKETLEYTVKNMKDNGMSIEMIMKITGLQKEEVEKI